jgi:ABC-2 type transport system permease protein
MNAPANPSYFLAVKALCVRDLIRFWRERTRVFGFLGTPLIFWLVVGSGFGNLGYYFPGSLTLTVMFSAIFSMISLIEDRREGFLLSMMVSPAPRSSMVMGKVLGSSILAWLQSMALLVFIPVTGFSMTPVRFIELAAVLFAIAFTFTSIGFYFAWKMDTTQGFHAIMNLVLFPLWMVSGALFPIQGAHGWMQWLMRLNPMTYALGAVKRLLQPELLDGTPELGLSVTVTIACGLLVWAASTASASKTASRSQA